MDPYQLIDEIRRSSGDRETRRRCHDFLVENGRSDLFDDIDTRSALRQVRSAKEDVEGFDGPLPFRAFTEQKLHRVETLLEEHAERNGYDV